MRPLTRSPARRVGREDALIGRALEILKRRMTEPAGRYVVGGVASAKRYLHLELARRDREAFWVVYVDSQHRVLGAEELFKGTLTQTSVYPREIARAALLRNAAGVILCHNHPSGTAKFSDEDRIITDVIRKALALIDVAVLDHVLIAGADTASLASLEASEEAAEDARDRERRARVSAALKASWARRKARAERQA